MILLFELTLTEKAAQMNILGVSLSEPHTSESNSGIGASLSEPHTSESNGGIFKYKYILYIYLLYVVL